MNKNLSNRTKTCRLLLSTSLFIFFALHVTAQPSWVKKASKSVFILKTFAADGSLLSSTNGFYTGTNGEAVSNFTPFKGASSAIIIDAQGKEFPVNSILGANDMYDVVRFRVDASKTQPLTLSYAITPEGSMAWLLPYRETKSIASGMIRKTETFQGYAYYTVAMTLPQHAESCPLMNDEGEVIGMMQPSAQVGDTLSYALSAVFADSLRITGLTMFDQSLQQTQIRKELPDDLQEANLAVFMASSRNDSALYAAIVEDLIQKFPDTPDGYIYRAQIETAANKFAEAENDMNQALRVSRQKDETHFTYARMIYQKELYQSTPYEGWSLDMALSEIREAIKQNPQPTYRQLEADILFAQKQYDEACNIYQQLSLGELRSAEVFFSAARCKEMLRDTTAMLALMDSVMATFSRPYLKEAAHYLWARADARRQAGKFRDAINDMNDYEELMKASVNDNFYYVRHQTEIQGRLYQQALNDISKAIQMNPQEMLYYAEKASLEIRVGLYDDAMSTARECIVIDDQNSDGYLFLGLAQCMKGQKQEGLQNLQRALELGDPQAEDMMKRFQ